MNDWNAIPEKNFYTQTQQGDVNTTNADREKAEQNAMARLQTMISNTTPNQLLQSTGVSFRMSQVRQDFVDFMHRLHFG